MRCLPATPQFLITAIRLPDGTTISNVPSELKLTKLRLVRKAFLSAALATLVGVTLGLAWAAAMAIPGIVFTLRARAIPTKSALVSAV